MNDKQYVKPLVTKVRIIGLILALLIHGLFLMLYVKTYEASALLIFNFTFLMPVFAIYIYSKLILATAYRNYKCSSKETHQEIMNATVSLVIPFYNEELDVVKQQVESIRNQMKQFTDIYYVDDGSVQKDVSNYLYEICTSEVNFHLYISEENEGKREAQGKVLPLIKTDYIMTTDSDTILDENCLFELMIPFFESNEKEKTVAVTGKVIANNANNNLLTRILNMRYFNAFESERAAQSATKSVIVASGPCSIYKTNIVHENLNEYLNQYFLNKKQTFGDDRCLTNISLKYGDVVYQNTAVGLTNVPENFKTFTKQQVRWSRSFFRESFLGTKKMIKAKHVKPLLWILLEIVMFTLMTITISSALYSMIFESGYLGLELGIFFSFLIVNSIVRNIYYFSVTPATIFLAPMYGLIHLFIVMPVKVYALLTLKNIRWITR